MRILIIHDDEDESQRVLQAALQVWGGLPLVQAEIICQKSAIELRLADETRWPDVILANVGFLERQPDLAHTLEVHPARGFYRLLALSTGADEYVRAMLQQYADDVVPEPITSHKLVTALCHSD
jgi:hypothetical protein